MPVARFLALPLFLLFASAAQAEEYDFCRNGLFPAEPPFALAEVVGKDRLHFLDDMDGCPDKGVVACKGRAYVVPGDRVAVSRTHGDYTCAFYPGKGGGTAGWVETRRLVPVPVDRDPPQSAWIGLWEPSGGNPSVRFFDESGALSVIGEAYWPGRPGTHHWPSTHIGEIAGQVARSGASATYSDDDACEIAFTLLGDWLVAGDNNQCGGANVSFSAVYRRTR